MTILDGVKKSRFVLGRFAFCCFVWFCFVYVAKMVLSWWWKLGKEVAQFFLVYRVGFVKRWAAAVVVWGSLFVRLFVFSWFWFGRSCRFLCAGEAIILGFQHYFTMLGTTVLIPSLVILNINGHSVCSSRETLTESNRKERFRKILIFFLYFLCHEMRFKKLFFATASLWSVWCGHCGKIVCLLLLCFLCLSCLLQSDLARVVQSALFVSGINTLLQTVLGSRLPVVMGNSFYFLPITLSIVNAPRIIDIPDPHEVTDHPPLILAHTPGTSDLRNSPFNLYFCGLSLSLCLRAFESLITNEDFFFSFRFAEISTRNESDTRSLHRRLSAQHHTRIQRPMGHSCQVMKAACLHTCIKVLNLLS